MTEEIEYITVMPNENLFVFKLMTWFSQKDCEEKDFIYKQDLLKKIDSYQTNFKVKYFYINEEGNTLFSEGLDKTLKDLESIIGLKLVNVKDEEDTRIYINDGVRFFEEGFTIPEDEEKLIRKTLR